MMCSFRSWWNQNSGRKEVEMCMVDSREDVVEAMAVVAVVVVIGSGIAIVLVPESDLVALTGEF